MRAPCVTGGVAGGLRRAIKLRAACATVAVVLQAKRDDDSVDTETTEDSDGQDDDTELVSKPVWLNCHFITAFVLPLLARRVLRRTSAACCT